MKSISIKINDIDYPIKFGYSAIKILSEMLEIDSYQETVTTVRKNFSRNKEEPLTFDDYEMLGAIFLSGIKSFNPDVEVTVSDVIDTVFKDVSIAGDIMKVWYATLPKDIPSIKGSGYLC